MIITVTGLPRSGTAFVSNLLQMHPECIAYHELASYDKNWRETIINNPFKYVADCCTYGFLDAAKLETDRPIKQIYIKSYPKQSHKSAQVACKKEISLELIQGLHYMALEWADINQPLIVERDAVFTEDGCAMIWHYCFGTPIPFMKIAELVKLNVQHKDPHIKFGPDVMFDL